MSSINGTSNGHSRTLKPGVWAPIPTFFNENEEIDYPTFKAHVVRLAKVGMQPVVCGSMGEGHHLTHEERIKLFATARAALDEAGLFDTVLIAGTGAGSTRETISLSVDAAAAGADIAIVIPPGYFAGALSSAALKEFFVSVAAASPIPVMLYNFPGAAGGLDLDSDVVTEIARAAPNVCGIKLTCGAVGKLTRITAKTATPLFADFPRKSSSAPDFVTLGGFADFLLPSILGGRAHGAIMGLGNIYPRALSHLFNLSQSLLQSSDPTSLSKALALQDLASATDQAFFRAGIAGTKWFLHKHNGYPTARMRRPLLDFDEERGKALESDPDVIRFLEIEKALGQ